MSTRAIASATGTGYGTVARELAGDPNGSPEPNPVTGTDGKTYSPRPRTALNTAHDPDDEVVPGMTAGELDELNVQPRPGPVPADPPKPKRRPLEEQFFDATQRLSSVCTTLQNLGDDDRLPRNREQVARYRSDLLRAIDTLQRVVNQMS